MIISRLLLIPVDSLTRYQINSRRKYLRHVSRVVFITPVKVSTVVLILSEHLLGGKIVLVYRLRSVPYFSNIMTPMTTDTEIRKGVYNGVGKSVKYSAIVS